MTKPPESQPPSRERHLVSLKTDAALDGVSFTIEPYDGGDNEALTVALETSWLPGQTLPVSSFMLRRGLQLEEERLEATLADARTQGSAPTELEGLSTATSPQAHGLGRAGLYLVVDNSHIISAPESPRL